MVPELEILCWAASDTLRLPDVSFIDRRRLLSLFRRHRMLHRLVDRLEREPKKPVWCTPELFIRLRLDRRDIERDQRAQISAAREIAALATDPQNPPIFLKGFTTYAHLNERRAMHTSGDVDVLPFDCEAFFDRLREAGFTGECDPPGRHSYASLAGRDVKIDLHKWFPAYSTPMEVGAQMLQPEHHPGVWLQEDTDCVLQRPSRITYEDLRDAAAEGRASDARGLMIPDPTMATILLCAHQMKNLGDFPERSFRLGELADINDLARHDDFSPARFHALVDQYDLHETVSSVAGLAYRLLNESYLPVKPTPAECFAPVYRWASFGFPPEDMLAGKPDILKTVQLLQANPIQPGVMYTTHPKPALQPLHRQIIRADQGEIAPIELTLDLINEQPCFRIRIGELLRNEKTHYTLYLLVGSFDCQAGARGRVDYHIHPHRPARKDFGEAEVSCMTDEKGYEVTISYPWVNTIWPLPAMLYFVRWNTTELDTTSKQKGASLVLPLLIDRER